MKKNAAEQIFMDVISEVPSIKRNGITHSDEFYEAVLNDANLSNEERAEALFNIRHTTGAEIEELTKKHCEIAQEIATFENDPELLDEAILEEQRNGFRVQVLWLFVVLFVVALLFILIGFAFDNFSSLTSIVIACFGALIMARLLSNKPTVYANIKSSFLDEFEMKNQELINIKADILSLERLKSFIGEALHMDNKINLGEINQDDLK